MLAEKFFLVLETLRSHAADDRPEIKIKTSPVRPPADPETCTGSRHKKLVPGDRD
jgi:hypothetical protein